MTDKEKLEKAVKLADAMYYAAQYLTTDASRLRKAMEDYHQFIIREYNKQEPASEDLEQAAIDYDSCRPALYGEDDEGDYVEYIEVRKDAFIAGAQWDREEMMKGAVDGEVNIWGSHISLPRVLPSEFSKQRVKVIIIRSE